MRDQVEAVRAALATPGAASSDFDLNGDVSLPENRKLRPAGVLAALIEGQGGLDLLLTTRSSALKHHPGQIALPGGKQDAQDPTPRDAALREAEEEIGLPRTSVEILGALSPHETVTGFLVTPVFGYVARPFAIRPEPGEVAEVFRVPMAHVLNRDHYVVESRRWRGRRRSYYAVPYGPYYIWGATARMLRAWAEQMTR